MDRNNTTPKKRSQTTVAVIAAHPDDEILGCGGTMAKHVSDGDEVHVLILAEGLTSREVERDRLNNMDKLTILAQTAQEANQILGVESVTLKDLPDNRLDSMDRLDIIKIIEEFINTYNPDLIYTHHIGDLNIDHRRIHEAVVTAGRPIPGHNPMSLLFFEVPSSTEWQAAFSAPPFIPNWFVDISSSLGKKLEALEKYKMEMRDWPHSRSIEAVHYLAKWRGASAGVEAAESFMLGRHLA
jgi:N-acetylglucosamine malate deacetylase 1